MDEVNAAYQAAADGPLKGYLHYTERPDRVLRHRRHPLLLHVRLRLTMTFGDQVKVIGWYDNEWGYSSRLSTSSALVGGRSEPLMQTGSTTWRRRAGGAVLLRADLNVPLDGDDDHR